MAGNTHVFKKRKKRSTGEKGGAVGVIRMKGGWEKKNEPRTPPCRKRQGWKNILALIWVLLGQRENIYYKRWGDRPIETAELKEAKTDAAFAEGGPREERQTSTSIQMRGKTSLREE